jgi:hypothetical protein
MHVTRLAQRRRQHIIMKSRILLGDSASSWHVDALAAWLRDYRVYSDAPIVCLSPSLGELLSLSCPSEPLAASFGLAVLDDMDAAALTRLEDTGATTALWLTERPERLIAGSAELRRAASMDRLTQIDLTDDFQHVDLDTPVLLEEGAFSASVSLHEAFELADRREVWKVAGAKLEQELASRLEPLLAADATGDQTFEALVALGMHHPAVRRVRQLRERYLEQRQIPGQFRQRTLPEGDPTILRAWLTKEAKRRSKTLSVRLPFAERLVAREYGATDFDELLQRASRAESIRSLLL